MLLDSAHTLFIDPRPNVNPHVPAGTTCIPLHPIALWPISTIPSLYVFPGELDTGRLVQAVKDVSAVWPIIAGRYVRKSERPSDPNQSAFMIDLTGSPIPITTATITAERAFETKQVIQPTLEPYMNLLDPGLHQSNHDHPLLSIRLTTLLTSRQSVLGIAWAHILGDAATCNVFFQHLSFFYVNGPAAKLDPQHMPNFFPHITMPTYPLDEKMLDTYQVKQVYPSHTMADVRRAYADSTQASEPILVALSRAEISAMLEECTCRGTDFLSTQDVLSAWWITVLRRAGHEVRKLIYTVNYRGLHRGNEFLPSNLPTLAGNVAQMLRIELPSLATTVSSDGSDARAIALAIRSAMNNLRQNPQVTIDWLSAIAYRLEEAAENERGHLVLSHDSEEALINSNLRYNWIIPFGFPWDETSYHTTFSAPRSLRVYEANPEKGEKYGETKVELLFNVIKGGEERRLVEGVIAEDRKRWASAIANTQ